MLIFTHRDLQQPFKMCIRDSARGMIVDQCIEDYGSGLNYNRRKWNGLLDEVMEQKVKTIVITHKDRFIRFGYDWFERFCMKFHTTILVVNNEELSPQRCV